MSNFSPEKPLCPRFIARRIKHEGVNYDFVCHTQHPLFVAKVKETEIDITDDHFISVDKIELNKKSAMELAKMMGQLAEFIAKWRSFQNGKSKDVPE